MPDRYIGKYDEAEVYTDDVWSAVDNQFLTPMHVLCLRCGFPIHSPAITHCGRRIQKQMQPTHTHTAVHFISAADRTLAIQFDSVAVSQYWDCSGNRNVLRDKAEVIRVATTLAAAGALLTSTAAAMMSEVRVP